nr:FHA domain-containing protein [Planctomonas sp. JC2975]
MGGGKVPRLVTVDSVEHDISRNHVQLTIEGGTVVVTDLHSRNGTLIALPGKTPQKLRAGEPTSVIAGTTIDLGSGVTLDVVQA